MNNIAILAPYVGSVNRGAETFVIELTKKLVSTYGIDVYTLEEEATIIENIITVDVHKPSILLIHEKLYNRYDIYRRIINKIYCLHPDVIFQYLFSKRAFSLISNKKYDLLFPNNGIWGAIYSRKYREKNGTPFIYTGHGGIGRGEKIILNNNPNAYICLTKKQFAWANAIKSDRTQIHLIPNGVNVSNFMHCVNKINQRKIVLTVGALTNFKRHELTIAAISKLKDVELIILGKGEEEVKIRKLSEKLLHGRCLVTATDYESINEYYKMADLFVLPSKEEPFGIVYLEAMAANLPIVAPDDCQRREIIENAGLFCNVENVDEYANNIKLALSINWGTLPRDRALKYDWIKISDLYSNLIFGITNGGLYK